MQNCSLIAGWMSYAHLDDGAGLAGVFTLAYKITDDSAECWSSRFSRFKAKDVEALWGAAHVLHFAVPDLFEALGLIPAQTLFVPALSSGETKALEEGHIPQLTRATGQAVGAVYSPTLIEKQIHRPIHSIYNAKARGAELDRAAYVAGKVPKDVRTVVIVDDFVTRGGTMSRIARAIQAMNPAVRAYGIALGKTERRAYWAQRGQELSNMHVLRLWNNLWLKGEYLCRLDNAGRVA